MQFLKKHYEKIVLSVVLLGLAVAAFFLTVKVQNVKQDLEEKGRSRIAAKKEPVKPVDLSTNEAAFERLSKPVKLEYSGEHNLANPLRWIKDKSGNPIPDLRVTGVKGLSLVKVNPLYLSIQFERVVGEGDDLRYQFLVERQHAKKPDQRRRSISSAKLGGKTQDNQLVVRDAKPKENPAELNVDILETGENVVITPEKPYAKVMGYSADLKHEFDRKDFRERRVDDTVLLDGVAYKIVAIGKDEVVISDPDSKKRTIIRPRASQ